ncbi:MAG: CDP-alcohol phosphatidyltransferase family protein [Methanomicrobiales archaeon]|nr:CDP-alcohol phosphatidyltransferase family protein [Methanomicrobiales archaeon]
MTLDRFRPHVGDLLRPLVRLSIRAGASPDLFSILAFVAACSAGLSFFFDRIVEGIVFVLINALADALDGTLARELKRTSLRGDLLDHALDRYADIVIITGIFAGGAAPWIIGIFALTGVLMSSYMGTQGQALGVGRYYGGVLGRADRLVLIVIAGLLDLLLKNTILGMTFLGWLLLLFGILGHGTAIQRFLYIWKRLG